MTDISELVGEQLSDEIKEQLAEILHAVKDGKNIAVKVDDPTSGLASSGFPQTRIFLRSRRVILHQTKAGRWHWRLFSADGNRVDARSGDGFSREDSARRGVMRQYPHLRLDIEVRRA
ncbi:hypothetical protein [Gordonia sp. OPL2]|uniref:hypothetical protein n=1 Tax=Gordonia sp. OPL2 TaxID=2486274 RepID=UPI001655B01E|nr:hypothetical protein [Gordonia sp. OPL2]ROZ88983.1 hypothetical protein EEB19_19935 [Gordonia sp. OPL2]